MSETIVPKGEITEDYTITTEVLRSDVRLPFILVRFLFIIIAVAANIALVYYLLATRYDLIGVIEFEIAVAVTTGLVIFVMGLVGGKIWISVGYRLSRATYEVYLRHDKTIFQKIFSSIYVRFTEPSSKIYLEAKAKDPRLSNPINLSKLVIKISISQLSFFVLATAFLARPFIQFLFTVLPDDSILLISESNQLIVQNILAMGVAVSIMGLYIPMNYIMTDSNIRIWSKKDLKIGTPSQKIRSRVDNLVGIGAILSGWGIYLSETKGGQVRFLLDDFVWKIQGYDIAIALDYALWLGVLLVLAWPLIIPASIYYFQNHEKTVNKFRAEASQRGVPIGVTTVRLPDAEEEQTIKAFEETQIPSALKEPEVTDFIDEEKNSEMTETTNLD